MSRGDRISILGLYNYDPRIFNMMVYPDGMTSAEKEIVRDNILLECSDLELLYPSWESMQIMIKLWSQIEKPVWNRIYNASKLEYNPIDNYNRTEKETITTDRTETHSGEDKTTAGGTDTTTQSGSDSLASTGTDTSNSSFSGNSVSETNNNEQTSGTDRTVNSNTGYNGNQLYITDDSALNHNKSTDNQGETETTDSGKSQESIQYGKINTTTYGRQDSVSYGKTDTVKHGEQIDHEEDTTREVHTYGNIGVTTTQQMLEQEINIAPSLNIMQVMVESFKERFCILVY